MCDLFDNPDANGKMDCLHGFIQGRTCETLNSTENSSRIRRKNFITKLVDYNLLPRNAQNLHKMDLAAKISEFNLDTKDTVEQTIESQMSNKKSYGMKHQPLPKKENDTDYQELKAQRKNYKKSVRQVKQNERSDLIAEAVHRENAMNEAHAIRREEKRAAQRTPEEKEASRKFYNQRRNEAKRKEAIRNKGVLGPLDFDNDLTREMRLKYYNRHHKCHCGKKFNIIFRGSEAYVVRCDHKKQVPAKISSNKKCLSCGNDHLEMNVSSCGCKSYYCPRCKNSNYFYKDVLDEETGEQGTAYQSYDCHPNSRKLDDLHFTLKMPDRTVEFLEGSVPIAGSLKDVIIVQHIAKAVHNQTKTKVKSNELKGAKFFVRQRNDAEKFSWAERVAGQKSTNRFNTLEDEVVEEVIKEEEEVVKEDEVKNEESLPIVMESEEQGGMVSTVVDTAKKGTSTAYEAAKKSVKALIKDVLTVKDKILQRLSIANIISEIVVESVTEKFDIVLFYLNLIYDNMDFEFYCHLGFMLANSLRDGIISFQAILKNVIHIGMLAHHVSSKTEKELDALENFEFEMPDGLVCKDGRMIDAAVRHLQLKRSDVGGHMREIYARGMQNFPTLKAVVMRMLSSPDMAKWISVREGKSEIGNTILLVRFNALGMHHIQKSTLASCVKILGVREEAGFSFDGLCNCLKESHSLLFSKNSFNEFFKLMRTVSPLFTVYRGTKEFIRDLSNAISKFIFGQLPPEKWLEVEMYSDNSPIHKLYSTYLAYVSTTVPGAKNFLPEFDASELRSEFYKAKEAADNYVMENKMYSIRYGTWIRYMEAGMVNPPQPKERKYEPTVLVLYGPPGCGKSTIWPHIVGYALGMTPKEVRESTHTWANNSEYQPGMASKRVVLFDDFGQDRTKNDEVMNLISLCTSAPFMVNSANITGAEIKGMFAEPDIIVLCTNDKDLATDKVFSSHAVKRRMDIYVTMEKQLDFKNPDAAKIEHFHITSCNRYPDLGGKRVSLANLSALTKVMHLAKRDAFKQINRDITLTFDEINIDTILQAEKGSVGSLPDFVVNVESLSEDWKKYFDMKEEPPRKMRGEEELYGKEMDSLEDQLRHYESVDSAVAFRSWYKSVLSQGNKNAVIKLLEKHIQADDKYSDAAKDYLKVTTEFMNIEESREQGSITFAYLTSVASTFILGVVNTSQALLLPTYMIAAFVTIYHDMKDVMRRPTIGGAFGIVAKTLGIAIGGVMMSFAAYKALQYFGGNSEEAREESGATRTARAVVPMLSTPQSGNNDAIINLAKQASGTLVAGNGRQINCVAIGGTWLLTANHFFVDFDSSDGILKSGTEMVLVMATGNQVLPFKFERNRFVQFENHTELFDNAPIRPDIALYRMDETIMPAFKNIMKHFWDGSYNLKGMPVVKVDYTPDVRMRGDRADLAGNIRVNFESKEFEYCFGAVEDDQVLTIRTKGMDRYYHYVATATYASREKSCGSLIARTDINEKPFLGIHVAAVLKNGMSMFHFVTYQELHKATANHVVVEYQESPFIKYGAPIKYQSDFPESHQFYYLGTTDKKHKVFQPTKTDLKPSLVFEALGPHTTEPSLLSKDDPRIPPEKRDDFWPTMYEGYANYTNLTFDDVKEAVLSIIVDNRRLQHKHRMAARVLTDDEVLNGNVNDFPSLGRVPMDTSCGWPYNCEGKKKKDLIDDIDGVLYMKERLRKDYEEAERCLDDGIVPFLPFTATVKDERVKLKKIYDTPKSRVFMAGNVVNYMLNRKYYGWFQDMHARTQWSYAACCLDRISVEWHYFISSLIQVGDRGFDGDFKWWDKFINSVLKYSAFLIDIDGLVQAGCIRKDSPKYFALMEMKTRTIAIFGENVYLCNGTEPSGELLTFMDNSTMNEVVHRTAYLQIMRKLSPMDANIPSYKAKTRGARAGDDTIQMVAASISKYFNGRTFSEWCKSKNISITAADKSEDIKETVHFKELSFVKNKTGTMHSHYVPLGELDVLIEQTYWVRLSANNKDIVKATADNVNAALRGIYYHGKETYNKIRDALLRRAPQLDLLTFSELDLQWQKYGYFPGSHSDYATKTDQDPMRTFNPNSIKAKFGENSSSKEKMQNVKIIESEEQSAVITGKDIGSMNVMATHPMASLDETITPKVVDDTPPASTSNTLGSETQVNGSFIQSKEDPVRKQIKTGKVTISPSDFRAQGHLNDKQWTLSKLASKFTSLGQVSWPISAVPGTILKRWSLPNDILTTPALKTPFDVTAFERFQSITFKITTSASPFYAGRLIAGFYPTFEEAPTTPSNNMHLALTQLGGVVLNPTDNQTVEYSIPFRHYLNWLEYPYDFVGVFYIAVLNPLKTGPNNVNNITVSVFVSVENAQFKVPEYVGPVTKSQAYTKILESRQQSGNSDDDTSIVITKRVATVNEDFQASATMMCSGTGTYVEPLVKQFPDHPIDLMQMRKRDTSLLTLSETVPAMQGNIPGFFTIEIPYMDIMNVAVGYTGELYSMFRGSLMIKGSFWGFDEGYAEASKAWEGRAYYIDRALPTNYTGSYDKYFTVTDSNVGYHKFDQDHPACFTVPHWSPNFASRNRGEPHTNQTPIGFVILEIYNFKEKKIKIQGSIECRIDDDFTMGVFTGFPGMIFVNDPTGKRVKYTKRSSTQREDDKYVLIQSAIQSGIASKAVNSAEDWVKGAAGDAVDFVASEAKNVVNNGISTVFDLARENLEPVMDVIDMVGNLLDAPPITLQAAPYTPRKWNYGNANNIMQYTEKLGATNHNGGCYTDKTTYGTAKNETNMYDLMTNVKTLWKTASWTTSQNSGTVLNWFTVGPNGTEDTLNNNSKVCVPMDYFQKWFNYWSGSIVYAFDIVSSQMHTGRITISYHPNLKTLPNGFTLDQATQQYFLSFDLDKGKGCAVVEVPYLHKRPFRPISMHAPTGTQIYPYTDGFNGIIVIWVQNPLRASETVAPSVDINIYKMAGKDFRFEGYGSSTNGRMHFESTVTP